MLQTDDMQDLPQKEVHDIDSSVTAALARANGVPLRNEERAAVASTLAYFAAGVAPLDAYLQTREQDDNGEWFPCW